MSNLPSSMTFKLFIDFYKEYELSQDSNNIKVKDHTLDLEIVRLDHHILEVIAAKEETQELLKHKSNLTIIKEETQLNQTKEQEPNV
jgi:hypothetical protein